MEHCVKMGKKHKLAQISNIKYINTTYSLRRFILNPLQYSNFNPLVPGVH